MSDKAIIFDIIHSSFVDGPGIRTAVFFKGCNLKCQWCHNPESQSFKKEILFYKNNCTNCKKCKEICPNSLEKCQFCGKCELYCPNNARKLCGNEMSVDQIYEEIAKDKDFYDVSGGGVTFSGGECMLQIDFLTEILKKCKQNGIHTAVDTAGCVAWESFEKILPFTDLFLYDIKLFDSQKHLEYIGADNSLIIENIKRLSTTDKQIIVRIPVIGGVNDNEQEMLNIAKLLKPLNISKVELLPYHSMGENKFKALDRPLKTFKTPEENAIEHFKDLFN